MPSTVLNIPLIKGNEPALVFLQRLSLVAVSAAYLLPMIGMGEGGYSICWLYNSTHLPCPGCGLTRSVITFFHLDWQSAWFYHPFGIVIAISFLVLSISAFMWPVNNYLIKYIPVFRKAFIWFFVLLAVFGTVRLLVLIFAPEILGGYSIVNTEKRMSDFLPVLLSGFSF